MLSFLFTINNKVLIDIWGLNGYVDSYDDYDFINYSVKDVDNRFAISIKDISSLNLSSIYYIGVYNYDKDEEIYFCYSPMFYIAKAIESEDKDLANLCKAMYFYNMAAKEY